MQSPNLEEVIEFIKLLIRLAKEEPVFLPLALFLLLITAIGSVLIPRIPELVGWLGTRRKRNITQINEWINSSSNSSIGAQYNLYAERERLMLLTTRGISANSFVRKGLVDISEDKVPGGVSWNDLRLAQKYLEIREGNLKVSCKKGTWAYWGLWFWMSLLSIFALLSGLVVLVLLLLPTFLNFFVSKETLPIADRPPFWMYVAFASYFVFAFFLFATPSAKFWASRRVEEYLLENSQEPSTTRED